MTGLSPQERMLRIFDEVASAVSAITRVRPVALLFDDLQWADEDSIQMIRYLVRTLPTAPILLLITVRPYSESSGAGKLIADLDRMRVTHVLRLERFTRMETAEFLENVLGSPVDEQTVQSLHARSEGVPFFIEEFARAYREADALQLMDGTWMMTRLSGPMVPSSIQSLIERRLAQLSGDCRDLLADAGVLGRRFRLSVLAPVLANVRREDEKPEWELAEELGMAVQLGLIVEEADDAEYDFTFSHDQIRASLLDDMPRRRRQAIHGAITRDPLVAGRRGGPVDARLPRDEIGQQPGSRLECGCSGQSRACRVRTRGEHSCSSTAPCPLRRTLRTGSRCSGSRTMPSKCSTGGWIASRISPR